MTVLLPNWRAEQIAKLVGCDALSVQEILQDWRGQNLSRMTEREIADEITARLDDFVSDP